MPDEGAPSQRDILQIPSMYVDAVEAHVQPFSVHLVLGAHELAGDTMPRVHLTMSPSFARHLQQVLNQGLQAFVQQDETPDIDNASAALIGAQQTRATSED